MDQCTPSQILDQPTTAARGGPGPDRAPRPPGLTAGHQRPRDADGEQRRRRGVPGRERRSPRCSGPVGYRRPRPADERIDVGFEEDSRARDHGETRSGLQPGRHPAPSGNGADYQQGRQYKLRHPGPSHGPGNVDVPAAAMSQDPGMKVPVDGRHRALPGRSRSREAANARPHETAMIASVFRSVRGRTGTGSAASARSSRASRSARGPVASAATASSSAGVRSRNGLLPLLPGRVRLRARSGASRRDPERRQRAEHAG